MAYTPNNQSLQNIQTTGGIYPPFTTTTTQGLGGMGTGIQYYPPPTHYIPVEAENYAIIETERKDIKGIIIKHNGVDKKVTLEELAVALGLEW